MRDITEPVTISDEVGSVPTSRPHPPAPVAEPDLVEQLAAEFLLHEGEVVCGDRCDELDQFTDAALADRLTADLADRFDEPVDAFTRLRSE